MSSIGQVDPMIMARETALKAQEFASRAKKAKAQSLNTKGNRHNQGSVFYLELNAIASSAKAALGMQF